MKMPQKREKMLKNKISFYFKMMNQNEGISF